MSERPSAPPARVFIPFHDHVGIDFLPTENGKGGARIPDAIHLTNHFGSVHGGALFAVGEVGAARAVISLLGDDMTNYLVITTKAEIRYLKKAHGSVTAEALVQMDRATVLAEIVREGRARPKVHVVLKDGSGAVVGELTVESYVSAL